MSARAKTSGGFTHRVLVADAYAASRAGIRAAMAPYGFAVAAEAADVRGALEAAEREQPDVCLVSLSLQGSGPHTIRAVAQVAPAASIVALADDDATDHEAIAALAAGASGFLRRADALERLPGMLAAALDGHAVVPAPLMTRLAERAQYERRSTLWRDRPRTTLSPRERQVLEGLRTGKSTAEIAIELGVSAVTVRLRVRRPAQGRRAGSRRAQ